MICGYVTFAVMDDLTNLSIQLSNPRLSIQQKLASVCNSVKKSIPSCNRVGIWLFSTDYSEMVLLKGIDENSQVKIGEELFAESFASYFDHVLNQQFLVSSDARNCEVASCFNVGYFDVHNIHSLLDYTFSYDFKPLGIICCERTCNKVEWREEDLASLKRIANLTSTFLAEQVSKTYQVQLKSSLLASVEGEH